MPIYGIILILCFLFVIWKYYEELSVDWKRVVLLVLICLVPFISWFINREIITAPENAGISSNLFLSYAPPQMLLFLSIFSRKMNPYLRAFCLLLGVIWFGYLMLHYLIGFHNPMWENLGLSLILLF